MVAKRKTRASLSKSREHQQHFIEEVFDDNLLPDAEELKKLQLLDPDIIEWIKERATSEQQFRHKSYSERIKLVAHYERGNRYINYASLFFSFLLLGGGLFLSYFLIKEGHEVLGTVFTGGILVTIGSLYLSKVKSNNNEKTPS